MMGLGYQSAMVANLPSLPRQDAKNNLTSARTYLEVYIFYHLGTDISKITRKPSRTGKPGHEKRKSTKEARDAKPKNLAPTMVTIHPSSQNLPSSQNRGQMDKGFSQLKGTEDNSRARLQDGRERLVKSSFSLTHSQAKATWLWKKAQGELGFTLGSLREVTQGSHQGLPAWQSV
ncbi:hypothetical protein Tco_0352183 [Tanacetum coccineum]